MVSGHRRDFCVSLQGFSDPIVLNRGCLLQSFIEEQGAGWLHSHGMLNQMLAHCRVSQVKVHGLSKVDHFGVGERLAPKRMLGR